MNDDYFWESISYNEQIAALNLIDTDRLDLLSPEELLELKQSCDISTTFY